jgi:hypothetical protein
MHVPPSCAGAADGDALKDFRLQGRAQTLHALEAVGLGGEVTLVKLQRLLGPQARDGEHFKNASRNHLAHRFQPRVRAGAVRRVMISAMASPTPGISRRRPSRMTSVSGAVRVPRLSAARA